MMAEVKTLPFLKNKKMRRVNLKTPVTSEVLTLALAKKHLNLLSVDIFDEVISLYIKSARAYVETFIRRSVGTQILELYLEDFPVSKKIELPFPPVTAINSFTYTNDKNQTVTFSNTRYVLIKDFSNDAYIQLKDGETWDTDVLPSLDTAIKIEFTAGYTQDTVPPDILHAMLLLVGHYFENREQAVGLTAMTQIPLGINDLLYPYRELRW